MTENVQSANDTSVRILQNCSTIFSYNIKTICFVAPHIRYWSNSWTV